MAKAHRKEQPERYKSQITLAERRIKAFEIAARLIEQELTPFLLVREAGLEPARP